MRVRFSPCPLRDFGGDALKRCRIVTDRRSQPSLLEARDPVLASSEARSHPMLSRNRLVPPPMHPYGMYTLGAERWSLR